MIKDGRFRECRTWYVVFEKPRKRWWWHLITGREFAHCWAFTQADESGVLVYEPLVWGVACTYMPRRIEEVALTVGQEFNTTAMLSVTVDYTLRHEKLHRGIYTCVSQLKALLGMRRSFFTITPFSLYKRLMRNADIAMGVIPIKAFTPYTN